MVSVRVGSGARTCVVQRRVAGRVAEENAGRVVVNNEAHDIGVALLAATHERRQTLRVCHVERGTKRVEALRSKGV